MSYELKFNYLISHDLKRQIYHVKNQICFFLQIHGNIIRCVTCRDMRDTFCFNSRNKSVSKCQNSSKVVVIFAM